MAGSLRDTKHHLVGVRLQLTTAGRGESSIELHEQRRASKTGFRVRPAMKPQAAPE
jgi:hypothetical protein